MQNVVAVVELCDLILEIYVADKNPLAPTHKRHYAERRTDDGTYVPPLQRVATDGNCQNRQ